MKKLNKIWIIACILFLTVALYFAEDNTKTLLFFGLVIAAIGSLVIAILSGAFRE